MLELGQEILYYVLKRAGVDRMCYKNPVVSNGQIGDQTARKSPRHRDRRE